MSDIEGREGQGMITGLNGLLLGAAKKRGFEAVCLMGEIPIYMEGSPFAYPKASRSVLNVLGAILKIDIDSEQMDRFVAVNEKEINDLYERLPAEIREQLDKLKYMGRHEEAEPGPITEEDKQKILEDIDKLFKKGNREP
jgi:proteasome assembly chaperone (PAC2) family protein